nr:cholinesterase-like isoform X1 [Plodia interpunctella]
MCPQNQMFKGSEFSKHNIREDCLVANIYVPNTNEKKLPVLVDIHGGGYQMGYGNMLTLNKLVNTKRVIVVNFNYRLGVYGFLCLGTRDVPGNAGMKDIVALLRWVKNNIAAFGGNPSEVTVSEYSAGPSAVQLLLLSPTAKDLFKRAIPENGPNLSIYSIQADPIEVAKKYAKKSPVPLGSTLPTWPPANAEGYPLMSIGQSLVLLGPQEERRHRMKFWHKIYDRYYRDPIPPPDRSSRVEL